MKLKNRKVARRKRYVQGRKRKHISFQGILMVLLVGLFMVSLVRIHALGKEVAVLKAEVGVAQQE